MTLWIAFGGRRKRAWRFLAILSAACMSTSPQAAEREVRDVVYDYAVTSYCGTLTPEVEAGYKSEVAETTARAGLSEDEAKKQRIAGWVAADLEWSNRGLGGFRAWCRSEGVEAARHFLEVLRGGS